MAFTSHDKLRHISPVRAHTICDGTGGLMPGIMWENRVEPGLKLTAGSVAAVADAAGAASTAWGCSDCCYHCWYTYVQVTG